VHHTELYRRRTWFRWWWPIAGILVVTSGALLVGSLGRLDDPSWLLLAICFAAAVAAVLLMPWNFVLSTVSVDSDGVRVTKWPGWFQSQLTWDDIAEAVVVDNHIYASVWNGRRTHRGTDIRISRRPISVDAYTDERAVLVTSRSGRPALLLEPGRDPEGLAQLINGQVAQRR
jgi:hypothetical protein